MIAIANDHVGLELKAKIIEVLEKKGLEYKDFGTYTSERTDYPVYAQQAADAVASGECDPLGGMGKGVRKIEKKLRETGHDVTMTLYPHVRHALVTEVNADRVFEDVYAFLAAHLPKTEE